MTTLQRCFTECFILFSDLSRIETMTRKGKHIVTGILFATLGFGLAAYFARRYRLSAFKKFKKLTSSKIADTHNEKVVIVNNFKDCQFVTSILQRKCEDFRVLGFDCEWVTEGSRNPVALMQLATSDGYCALIRLCYLKEIPQDLKKLLEDSTIYKVGVVPIEDAKHLMSDYGLVVRGCLDLRYLIPDTFQLPRGGLSGLAFSFLGIKLDKNWQIRCSDWEAPTLNKKQVSYASQDALVAVNIFFYLMQLHMRPWWCFWGSVQPKWSKVVGLCQNFIDIKYKDKSAKGDNVSSQSGSRPYKQSTRSYCTRQRPMYDNCMLQAPDGEILTTCDRRKAEWYLSKNLGEKMLDDPLTIRLLFEPSGRAVGDVGSYYTQVKTNQCVVCGKTDSYIRKNIVPHEYRRYFPTVMKDRISHDVLLLCLDCHLRSNSYDVMLRKRLAVECSAPFSSNINPKTLEIAELKQVKSAARILMSPAVDKVPEERKRSLSDIVLRYFDITDITELTSAMLEEASSLVTCVMNENYEPHGKRVVTYFSAPGNGGLIKLQQRWREHFLMSMSPCFLPKLWSVKHNEERLLLLAAEGYLQPEELISLGINSNGEE